MSCELRIKQVCQGIHIQAILGPGTPLEQGIHFQTCCSSGTSQPQLLPQGTQLSFGWPKN